MVFFQSLLTILHPSILLVMIIGSIGGIVIGAMPGLTSVMGVTLLLPFTYGMDALSTRSLARRILDEATSSIALVICMVD